MSPEVVVVIPTLNAGEPLAKCLESLEAQRFQSFEVIVVDNSGEGGAGSYSGRRRVIRNRQNVGFGAAINQGYRDSSAPLIATLNDDTEAAPGWLEALVADAAKHPRTGMFASCVMLMGTGLLDSAGMLLAADGSSQQRGHLESPELFREATDALCPSGSAALYRRAMLDEIGGFDESFFLYCEDTDLGLRARWAGWDCRYVPDAVVEHRYSESAGRASLLKAYYVERNRIQVAIKNFPCSALARVPFASMARYFWHAAALVRGRGKTAEFKQSGTGAIQLGLVILRAHAAAFAHLHRLWTERGNIRRNARLKAQDFVRAMSQHAVSVRKVAEH